LAAHFLDNNPGTRYDAMAPLMFSRHSYAREYAFANHDNAQALVRAAQDKFHAAALAAGKLSSAAEGTARPILSVKDSKALFAVEATAAAAAAGSSARPMEDVAPSTEPSPSPAPAAAAATAAAASEAESAAEDAGGHKKRHPRRFFEDYKKCTSMFFFSRSRLFFVRTSFCFLSDLLLLCCVFVCVCVCVQCCPLPRSQIARSWLRPLVPPRP
jgi:hypothetical protein